jgi:glycosyltransferase involved in cell wall biosynthesis
MKKPLHVAYLTNEYPHVRHTFIRREIIALEEQGAIVDRFSIRPASNELVDPADKKEEQRTQVLLSANVAGLMGALIATAVCRPLRWFKAMAVATRMGWRSHRSILIHWAYLVEACVLLRKLRRCGAAHLHAHFGTNSAAVALLVRILGGPTYSLTIHGSEEWDRPLNLSLQEKVEGAVFVATVSEFGRSQLFRWCSYDYWPRIHIVRCGVDALFLSPGPQLVPNSNRFVSIGAIYEPKGHLRLLEALSCLAAEGIPFEMLLVGDGPMRPDIEAEIRRRGLEGQVRITGWVSNDAVRKHILDCRALVLPSFAENLPVVLMEALALGRPAICSHIAGIPELVEDGLSGWLVPAGSVEALAGALRQALATPTEQLTWMGASGATRVADMHNASKEAAKLAALFESLACPVSNNAPRC